MSQLNLVSSIFQVLSIVLHLFGIAVCLFHIRSSARLWLIIAGLTLQILTSIWSTVIPFFSKWVQEPELMRWLFLSTGVAFLGARLLILFGVILLVFDFRRWRLAVHSIDDD